MQTIEILYVVLIIFTTVIWTLLSIVLYKTIKILNTLQEIIEIYNKVKQVLDIYSQIPEIILDYIKWFIFWKKD